MTPGFVNYWAHEITKVEGPQYSFAQKMVELPKVVFSRTLNSLDGRNVLVENGDLKAAAGMLNIGATRETMKVSDGWHAKPDRSNLHYSTGGMDRCQANTKVFQRGLGDYSETLLSRC